MKLAVDVHYSENTALVAGVCFHSWGSGLPSHEIISTIDSIRAYEPGHFYKRELPCILGLIQEHGLSPQYIVIDGYVFLDGHSKPGLGKHLYGAMGGDVVVIGVAKSRFKDISDHYAVYRGKSKAPLFVTSVGVSVEIAKSFILSMHGPNRIPTILKRVDQLCRGITE